MTPRSQLTPAQIRLLDRMDDGPNRDSVGIELADLSLRQARAMAVILILGLARADAGWKDTFWFRLTPKGRRVRGTG